MDEISSLIEKYDSTNFTDYKQWKSFCMNLIKKLTPRILNLSETQLLEFFESWQKDANKPVQIDSTKFVFHKLLMIYLLINYTYNFDLMLNYHSWLNSKLSCDNLTIVKASAYILKFSVLMSSTNSFVFKNPLVYVSTQLSLKKNIKNALTVLNQAIKVIPLDTIPIISQNFSYFLQLLTENDFDDTSRVILKIIKFYLEREHTDDSKQIYYKCFSSLKKGNVGTVYLLHVIYDIRSDLFIDKTDELINSLLTFNETTGCNLILKICRNLAVFNFDVNKFISILISKKLYSPQLKEAILIFRQNIDPNPIIECIKINYNENLLNNCVYDAYSALLAVFPDISISFTPDNYCIHYLSCIKERPSLLNDDVVNYFKMIVRNNDLSRINEALLFHTIHPFIGNIQNLIQKNFINIHEEVKLTILNNFSDKCGDVLISVALFDSSKKVRKLATAKISNSFRLMSSPSLYALLYDPSFKIRKKAIKMFSKLYLENPLDIQPVLLEFMQKIIEIFSNVFETSLSAKYASLIAKMCKYCIEIAKMCSKTIIQLFLNVTNSFNDELYIKVNPLREIERNNNQVATPPPIFSNKDSFSSVMNGSLNSSLSHSTFTECDPNSVPNSNSSSGSSNSNSILNPNPNQNQNQNQNPNANDDFNLDFLMRDSPNRISFDTVYSRHQQQPLRQQLLLHTQSHIANKRDSFLVRAIADLGSIVEPNLKMILHTFYIILKQRNDEKLLITTVKALIKLSSQLYNGLNINLQCPEILNPLTKIMLRTQNESLIQQISKLIGGNFDSIDVFQTQFNTSFWKFNENPTDFICQNLIIFIREPSRALYRTAAKVFDCDPRNSAKYASKYISFLIFCIENGSEEAKAGVFSCLEYIVLATKHEITPMIPEIFDVVTKNIEKQKCVHFCIALSYTLGGDISNWISKIYQRVLALLSPKDFSYFKAAMKFSIFSILYQHCLIDYFIIALEAFEFNDSKFVDSFVKYCCILIQNEDVSFYESRISILAIKLMNNSFDRAKEILINLVHSLGSKTPVSVFNFISCFCQIDIENESVTRYRLSFKPKPLNPEYTQPSHFFKDLKYPSEKGINRFIQDLVQMTISLSPNPSIRVCTELFSIAPKFIQKVFPLAFLSCWKSATQDDRDSFSSVVCKILQLHKTPHKRLLKLVQLTDMAGIPMKIDELLVADLSHSAQFSMYLLQKRFIKERSDPELIKKLLQVNLKMGHTHTIRTLLTKIDPFMTQNEKADWLMNIGDWEASLKILKKINGPLSMICKCYRYLGQPGEILKLEPLFDLTNYDENDESLELIAWAFTNLGQLDKAKPYIERYSKQLTPVRNTFSILFDLMSKDLESAERHIESAYKIIGAQKNILASGDQNQLNIYFNFLQLLIESQEALEFLKLNPIESSQMISIWKSRISGFKRSSIAWERMINLRKIAVPISTNVDFYTEIISVLRKERRYRVINTIFGKYFDGSPNDLILFEKMKFKWEYGHRQEAVDDLSIVIQMLDKNLTMKKYLKLFRLKKNSIYISLLNHMWTDQNFPFPYVSKDCFDYFNVSNSSELLATLFNKTEDEKRVFCKYLIKKYPKEAFKMNQIYALNVPKDRRIHLYKAYGYWMYHLNSNKSYNLTESAKGFLTATKLNPYCESYWRGWAYSNLKLFRLYYDHPKTIDSIDEAFPSSKSNSEIEDTEYEDDENETDTENEIEDTENEIEDIENEIKKNDNNDGVVSEGSFGTYYGVCFDDIYFSDHSNEKRVKLAFANKKLKNIDVYVINALIGFLKSASFTKSNSLEFLCQLFSVLFEIEDSSIIPKYLIDEILMISPSKIVKVLPQITAQIGHPDPLISEIVTSLLQGVGTDYFQRLYFALNVYISAPRTVNFANSEADDIKRKNAIEIIDEFRAKFADVIQDASLFISGMERASNTWFELWVHALECASRLRNESPEKAVELIRNQIEQTSKPICELDYLFIKLFGQQIGLLKTLINQCYPQPQQQQQQVQQQQPAINNNNNNNNSGEVVVTYFPSNNSNLKIRDAKVVSNVNIIQHAPTLIPAIKNASINNPIIANQNANNVINMNVITTSHSSFTDDQKRDIQLWAYIRQLYMLIQDKVNRLSVIMLTKVSEELTSKTHFNLKVPGLKNTNATIESLDQALEVIGTQQHPRCLCLKTSEGERLKYLLKGNEDLRKDERLMQLFSLVNSIFKRTRETKELQAYIVRYAVVPMTMSCGLIAWVTDADTFHQIVTDARATSNNAVKSRTKTDDKSDNKLVDINRNTGHHEYSKTLKEIDIIKDFTSADFVGLNKLQKYEVFTRVAEQLNGDELFMMMWKRSPNALEWMKRIKRFTLTSALMSMVGYIIGLGDRHPSNIMIQRSTGNVVHIDFGESFESTLKRKDFPEKVPFRLTRMIVNSLEGSIHDGMFTVHCNTIMEVMRNNISSMMAQLLIFVHEPLKDMKLPNTNINTSNSTSNSNSNSNSTSNSNSNSTSNSASNSNLNQNENNQSSNNNNYDTSQVESLINRVEQKLSGKEEGGHLSVKEQVDYLIKEAVNPMNYVQHYIGWCPFW